MSHARLSPSAAHRWIPCPGSVAMEEALGRASSGSEFAREGTAAHELAQRVLADTPAIHINNACLDFINSKTSSGWVITADMARDTQVYVDRIWDYAEGHTLLVEQRVDFSEVVGVPNSFGTADAIIITADGEELQIHDLKFGRGVQVFAEHNEQLMIYALGALMQYGLTYDFKRVRLVIHQPRLQHLSEWDCTIEELVAFSVTLKEQAQKAIGYADNGPLVELNPGEKQCRWCKASATCPALAKEVSRTVGAEFDELIRIGDSKSLVPPGFDTEALATKMNAIDLIESWCKAVRAEVERVLFDGGQVPGYKLVQGRQGNRDWINEQDVEAAFKAMRLKLDEMYDFKLISPTSAEKLLKDTPRRWKKVQSLVTRSPGKPSVAPVSDKRQPLSVVPKADDFNSIDDSLL